MHFIMQYEPGLIWTHWNQPHLALIRKVRLEFSAWLRVWKSCSRVTATASSDADVRDGPLRDGPARRATATRNKIWDDGADQDARGRRHHHHQQQQRQLFLTDIPPRPPAS